MFSIVFHALLPMYFYNLLSMVLFTGFHLGALEAAGLSALLISPFLFYWYSLDQRQRGYVPPVRLSMGGCLRYIIIWGFSFCLLGNLLIEYTGLTKISRAYEEVSETLYSATLPLQIGASGFLIPAAEELIFRGMIFAPIRDKLSFFPAAFFSALLFALFHGNLPQGVYAFIIGLALAWLYEGNKTLAAPYVFHASANVLAVLLTHWNLGRVLLSGEQKGLTAAATAISASLSLFCVQRISFKTNK